MVRSSYLDVSPLMGELLDDMGVPPGLTAFRGDPSPDELLALVKDAEIVLNGHTVMDDALLATAARLKSIIFLGTGASSYVDIAAAERRGIVVRTVRGYGDRTVAEHAFTLLLAAARDVARMDRDLRAGVWDVREGIELGGRTLGLIGLGGIGSEMARIASGFGMKVIAWNRSGAPAGVPVASVSLDELLATADAISLHLALTPETRGFLDAPRLARLKRGAILVNTARAALVDGAALRAALQGGHLRHAALDVFDTEPLPAGDPLTKLGNVTLTAHAGWKARAASARLLKTVLELAAADAAAIAAGQPLKL